MALTRTVSLKLFADTAAAQAKLDAISAEAERLGELNPSIKPAIDKSAAMRQLAVLRAELKAQGDAAGQDLGTGISDGTKKGLGANPLGGSWIAAAIGLGAPLAGPLTAAGLGFSAFGLLAAGSLAPVVKAVTGPAGLAAGWSTLDARQKTAVAGVEALKTRYDGLSKSMQPRTFQVFSTALSTANGLLGPLGRLATTSGSAVEGFLVQFQHDAGLQKFIGYASTIAPQAISLLGTDVSTLVHSVLTLAQAAGGTGLLELRLLTGGLQILDTVISHLPGPLAGTALGVTGIALGLSKLGALSGVLKITGLAAMGSEAVSAAKGIKDATIATRGLAGAQAALDAISPWGWAALGVAALAALFIAMSKISDGSAGVIATLEKQNNATGFNTKGWAAASKAIGDYNAKLPITSEVQGMNARSTVQLSQAGRDYVTTQQKINAGVRQTNSFLTTLEGRYGITRGQAISLANASGVLVNKNGQLTAGFSKSVSKAEAFGNANQKAQLPVMGLAAAVSQLTTAMQQNVGEILTLQGDQIGWRQSLQGATKQLDSNSAGLAGNSAKALANKAAVLASTNMVVTFASDQLKLHGNLQAASAEIQDQIGWLQKHGDKSRFAAAEIRALRGEEALIKKQISSSISVTGSGHWQVSGGGPSPTTKHFAAAAGMRVTGGIPGVDSVPILAQKDETVLSVAHSRQLAPILSAVGVPGYAAGGVVGSYAGSVPGLGKWLASEDKATVAALSASVAAATLAGMRAAARAHAPGPSSSGGHAGWNPGAGVAQWGADVTAALRQLGLPQAYKLDVMYQMMTESGGNPNIVNKWDSNWLAGHPSVGLMQVISGTFDTYAGPYRGTGPFSYGVSVNPMANLYAALNYGAHGRGFGTGSGQIGSGHGYADGTAGARRGWAWVGERGPELVGMLGGEPVLNAAQSAGIGGIGRGYASGTPAVSGGHGTGGGSGPVLSARQIIGLALAAYYQHPQSATADRAEEKKYLRDIAKYFDGSSAKWRDKAVERQTAHLISVGDKITAVTARMAAARSYQQSVQQGLSGYADLSQMTLGGSMQGSRKLSGAQSLSQQLHGQLGNLKAFATVLRKLSAAKVDSSLIRQVVALGPGDGTAFGQEILAGGPALIKSLNATESAIGKTETQISRGAASAVYEGKYEPGKDFLKQLQHDKAGLKELFRDLGQELGKEATRWFHVPRRRRPKGMAAGGMITEPVYGYGASGQEYMFGERGAERVTPLTGGGRTGPLITFGGDMVVRQEADAAILAQKVGFLISAAGLG